MTNNSIVAAMMIVRDEEDYIAWNIEYHLELGFDYIFITDHCSCDGTPRILEMYTQNPRVIVFHESDPIFDHGKLANRLLRKAIGLHQLDWIFLIDADEFLSIGSNIHAFVKTLEQRGILYASIGWANALFSGNTKVSSPIDTNTFYYPIPERSWQHQGHFRKSIARNHIGIEIVVGGHYFRSEANESFQRVSGGEPFIVPYNEAKYFHFEMRHNAASLLKKWQNLALHESDSSSRPGAPWLERIEKLQEYAKVYCERTEQVHARWFLEQRTFWGNPIPEENVFRDNTLRHWSRRIRKMRKGFV